MIESLKDIILSFGILNEDFFGVIVPLFIKNIKLKNNILEINNIKSLIDLRKSAFADDIKYLVSVTQKRPLCWSILIKLGKIAVYFVIVFCIFVDDSELHFVAFV